MVLGEDDEGDDKDPLTSSAGVSDGVSTACVDDGVVSIT